MKAGSSAELSIDCDAWFAHERAGDELVDLVASRLEVLGPVNASSPSLGEAQVQILFPSAAQSIDRTLRHCFSAIFRVEPPRSDMI